MHLVFCFCCSTNALRIIVNGHGPVRQFSRCIHQTKSPVQLPLLDLVFGCLKSHTQGTKCLFVWAMQFMDSRIYPLVWVSASSSVFLFIERLIKKRLQFIPHFHCFHFSENLPLRLIWSFYTAREAGFCWRYSLLKNFQTTANFPLQISFPSVHKSLLPHFLPCCRTRAETWHHRFQKNRVC